MPDTTNANAYAAKKTACTITRAQFMESDVKVEVVIAGRRFVMQPRQFSTGSLGWNLNDKIEVDVDGTIVKCQLGLNLTVVGSKELPE